MFAILGYVIFAVLFGFCGIALGSFVGIPPTIAGPVGAIIGFAIMMSD